MPPTRVLIFPLPRLLHDIMHQLLSDMDNIEVVECPAGLEGIAEAAVRAGADLVIAGERYAEPCAASGLLRQMPRVHTLAVSPDGRSAVLYELRPHRRAIGELSAETLRTALCAAAPAVDRPGGGESTTRTAP